MVDDPRSMALPETWSGVGLISGICQTKGSNVFTESHAHNPYAHSATVPPRLSMSSPRAPANHMDFSEANRLSFPQTSQTKDNPRVTSGVNTYSPVHKSEKKRVVDKTKVPSRFKVSLAPDPLKPKYGQNEMTHLKEDILHVLEKKSGEGSRNTREGLEDFEPANRRRDAFRYPEASRSVPALSRKPSFEEDEELSSWDGSAGAHPNVKFPDSPRSSPPKRFRQGSFAIEEMDVSRGNSPRPNIAGMRGDDVHLASKQLAVAEWAMRHAAERPHTHEAYRDSEMLVSHRYRRYIGKKRLFCFASKALSSFALQWVLL